MMTRGKFLLEIYIIIVNEIMIQIENIWNLS
jgi:hypothetical protein